MGTLVAAGRRYAEEAALGCVGSELSAAPGVGQARAYPACRMRQGLWGFVPHRLRCSTGATHRGPQRTRPKAGRCLQASSLWWLACTASAPWPQR